MVPQIGARKAHKHSTDCGGVDRNVLFSRLAEDGHRRDVNLRNTVRQPEMIEKSNLLFCSIERAYCWGPAVASGS